LGSRVGAAGVIRFNPSTFEREGVPGNGWSVVEAGREPRTAVVDLAATPDGFVADGLQIRLLDEPDIGDLYNFCPAEVGQVPAPPDEVTVNGHEVSADWAGLSVALRVTRRVDEDLLRLEGVIHNERPDHRLRLHVRLPEPTDRSLAGSSFELVDRPLVGEGGEGETPSSTWPARHVVMASDVAIVHEGVFEYEVSGNHELAVTLLRCVGTISREHLATRPFQAGPGTPTPAAQMLGETSFAVGVWAPAAREGLWERVERFALPLLEAIAVGGGDLPSSGAFREIDGPVQLSNIRKREGAVEVRLWNPDAAAPAVATADGREVALGPAEIRTITVGGGP
jgi:hypothetical protein